MACNLFLKEVDEASNSEEWRWDGDEPPGFSVYVRRVGDEVHVSLMQDLFGPIGPSEKYRTVKRRLLEVLKERFGQKAVGID